MGGAVSTAIAVYFIGARQYDATTRLSVCLSHGWTVDQSKNG